MFPQVCTIIFTSCSNTCKPGTLYVASLTLIDLNMGFSWKGHCTSGSPQLLSPVVSELSSIDPAIVP